MEKKVCYLVQGKSCEMDYFKSLLQGRDYVLLTWDQECDNALFYPNSSWAEGRKKLEKCIDIERYQYICFIDGDVKLKGCLTAFEQELLHLEPAVAFPVIEKTKKHATARWMLSYGMDEQCQFFNTEIYKFHFKCQPYITKFDKISWHFPCVILQYFLGSHLKNSVVTIPHIEAINSGHGEYPTSQDYAPLTDFMSQYVSSMNYYPLLNSYQSNCNFIGYIVRRGRNAFRLFKCKYLNKLLFTPVSKINLNKIPKDFDIFKSGERN
ncbi:hypothetical protein J0J21_06245 [Vibrio vulnificus]|uniref:hypothetical protein n=1 Tax=Vibrio vulnificus TaxID=672 RepID=UPI0019D4D47B|nr:hypothetical protein [Vibrio vulnificus]MBN8135364.1 hypothetical protein [Vibrio vulnificus]HDY7659518.1 hypothetical protein [Vibrio vulnificus]